MGLLEAVLWKCQDERGPSQQSWVSASPASAGGQHMGLGDYWTICWLALCILKYNLKANISGFRLFPVSRSISSMSRSITVIV